MATVLLVDDEPGIRSLLSKTLARSGHETLGAANLGEALRTMASQHIDLIIADWCAPGLDGSELLRSLRDAAHDSPVIVLTGAAEHAVTAMRGGAAHCLAKPVEPDQLTMVVDQALAVTRLREENRALLRELQGRRSEMEIVGDSRVVRRLLDAVTAAAVSRATILLDGEPGTGKELIARAIHAQSDRRDGPFVRVNCAALPEDAAEAALFGHEKGAYNGASKRVAGALERAHGGTLLLDEIGELRPELQPRLLRVLQDQEFERVGGNEALRVDVRIVATTSRMLDDDVSAGRFRQDLYYRLSAFPIHVPPLRARREDIPMLAQRFALRAGADAGKEVHGFSPQALELLASQEWPGNVRQLQNAVERAVILSTEPVLHASLFTWLPAEQSKSNGNGHVNGNGNGLPVVAPPSAGGHAFVLPSLNLLEVEQRIIDHALSLTGGNRTRAAELLGINVRTLRRKLNTVEASGVGD